MDIRQAQRTDCARLSTLIAQLGYHAAPALLERKLAEYGATEQNCVLVGVEEGHIVGLIVLNVVVPFHEDGPWGRISALVVADGTWGRGVGRALLEAMVGLEFWFRFQQPIYADDTIRLEWLVVSVKAHPRLGGEVVDLRGRIRNTAGETAVGAKGRVLVADQLPPGSQQSSGGTARLSPVHTG